MRLFILEIRRCLKNPFFWIVSIVLFLFVNSQFSGDASGWSIKKPVPGQESYGTSITEDMSVIRQQSLVNLLVEYSNNRYTTYPYGFYRNIELNTKKNEAMEKLLSALTGMSIEKIKSIQSFSESGHSAIEGDKVLFPEEVDEVVNSTKNNITDDDYLNLMDKVDQLLGGGSPYSKRLIASRFGRIPKSYEEALQEYNDMLYKDKITGAFARLFCDYAGIAVGFLPIFLVVAFWYQDRKTNISHTLYSKKASSSKLILSRFFAMLILFTFIIMLMATFYNIKIIGVNGIENTDPFAFYKYSFLWLIPTLMVVLSVGMFTTILTNSPVGIIAMLGWWFIAMFGSEANMRGGYGFQLFLRHNILGDTKVYLNNIHIVLLNRGIYITISAILVLISIKIYNKKRKGEIYSGSSKKNNKK